MGMIMLALQEFCVKGRRECRHCGTGKTKCFQITSKSVSRPTLFLFANWSIIGGTVAFCVDSLGFLGE